MLCFSQGAQTRVRSSGVRSRCLLPSPLGLSPLTRSGRWLSHRVRNPAVSCVAFFFSSCPHQVESNIARLGVSHPDEPDAAINSLVTSMDLDAAAELIAAKGSFIS